MDNEQISKPDGNKKQPTTAQNAASKANSNQNQKSGKNSNPDLATQAQSKKQQKAIAPTIETYSFLQNMDISDEFMKWCEEQLKYFNVELHIPTFVNFLKEIESCAEIEDYASSYLGESKQAKEFAQQFYLNRESQLKQDKQQQREEEYESNNSHQQQQAFSKKTQKKRSKGHKLDGQLLGFTVQPDPNLKNRGDIDSSM
jgi:PERQ amino acid-rich with GYF domain-containing protein